MKIGLIAEDDSDISVLRSIALALLKPHKVGFNRFVGDGCGKLRRKCEAWVNVLVRQGCWGIVVAHDLDRHNETELRGLLSRAVHSANPRASVVLIPKKEIEAWLLYDSNAIARAFNETTTPRLPGNPESITDPKKHLRDLVRRAYRKEYVNTIHNALIADGLNLALLKGSRSFSPYPVFAVQFKDLLKAPGQGVKKRNQGSSREKE